MVITTAQMSNMIEPVVR